MAKRKRQLELVGLAEAAEVLGWNRSTLSQRFHNPPEFHEGDEIPPVPEPVAVLRATPVWLRADMDEYARTIERRRGMGYMERLDVDQGRWSEERKDFYDRMRDSTTGRSRIGRPYGVLSLRPERKTPREPQRLDLGDLTPRPLTGD